MPTAGSKSAQSKANSAEGEKVVPDFRSRADRYASGKALRDTVPRESHGKWKASKNRRDPIDILEESNQDRLPQLVPIRYGRMLRGAFPFLRGSAGLMASDLATTPSTGIRVQACGDCHLMNFGMYATPERNLVFDINDFDETLPAPWEWDLKRLAASFVVAARASQLSDADAQAGAVECARAYREKLRKCSKMDPLDLRYQRLDFETIIAESPDAQTKAMRRQLAQKAATRTGENMLPKIAVPVGGRYRLVDQPPILFHPDNPDAPMMFREATKEYRSSLPDDRRVLFDHYHLEDFAIRVVGIGSVGTRCWAALFLSTDGHPLLMQFKEAKASVLEPYAGKSVYSNHGQRVVVGQRLMQAASDLLLGWSRSRLGYDFFGRQMRDMKISFPSEGYTPASVRQYAEICGRRLARAHAQSGDAATISGYVGKSDVFDQAIGDFALAYADQTVQDHAKLAAAVKAGRVKALVEEKQ